MILLMCWTASALKIALKSISFQRSELINVLFNTQWNPRIEKKVDREAIIVRCKVFLSLIKFQFLLRPRQIKL